MLPSSVRRVVASGPQAGLASCLATAAAPKAVGASAPVFVRGHQRRFSSSKPSRSDSGPNDVAAGQSVTTPATRGKSSSETRKRKSKDAKAASYSNIPSVPNTHISQAALGLSSFFSLHRPISVTETMPRAVSDEHFASIFGPRSKASKIAETTSTLSSAIDQIEGPMVEMTLGGHEEDAVTDGMQKLEFKNLDGSESSLYLQVDAMSGDFFPFRPPPLPEPQSAAELEGAALEAEAADEEPHHRVYKAMFTIEESTDVDGQVRLVAHSPRIVNSDRPRSFLGRLAQRQLRFDEARRRDMYAISVKRQRKLRMKKKKYKKLMKRTRNLRRKLDRT
jgi:hypothetical protein